MFRFLFAAMVLWSMLARAQSAQILERFTEKLDALERQNSDLTEQVRTLRAELEAMKRSNPQVRRTVFKPLSPITSCAETNACRTIELIVVASSLAVISSS